jgi:hypothetical protein
MYIVISIQCIFMLSDRSCNGLNHCNLNNALITTNWILLNTITLHGPLHNTRTHPNALPIESELKATVAGSWYISALASVYWCVRGRLTRRAGADAKSSVRRVYHDNRQGQHQSWQVYYSFSRMPSHEGYSKAIAYFTDRNEFHSISKNLPPWGRTVTTDSTFVHRIHHSWGVTSLPSGASPGGGQWNAHQIWWVPRK